MYLRISKSEVILGFYKSDKLILLPFNKLENIVCVLRSYISVLITDHLYLILSTDHLCLILVTDNIYNQF